MPRLTPHGTPRFRRFPLSMRNIEGDRLGSNPPPSEPQSADMRCWVLLDVAKSAYLSPIVCSGLRTVAARCALGGVSCGVKRYRYHYLGRRCCTEDHFRRGELFQDPIRLVASPRQHVTAGSSATMRGCGAKPNDPSAMLVNEGNYWNDRAPRLCRHLYTDFREKPFHALR